MQTVIDWYENKLIQLDIDFGGHKNYWIERKKIREQAKEMEKQQIIETWHNGYNNQSPMIDEENCGQTYYTSTYGSNGSVFLENYEQINQDNPVTRGSTTLVKVTSSQTDENGKPLTYWGGLKDRTCTNSCSVVCGECQILHISEDCEEVKNWDSFVEQKNKELYYQKQLMNPYSSDSQSYTAYEKGFIEGFEKAKETLYTEEQMVQAIKSFITYKVVSDREVWDKDINLYIQSLKKD